MRNEICDVTATLKVHRSTKKITLYYRFVIFTEKILYSRTHFRITTSALVFALSLSVISKSRQNKQLIFFC